MKKLLLIICISSFVVTLSAQKYFPFPADSAKWTVLFQYSNEIDPPDSSLLIYTLKGDTLINQINYGKLYEDIINPRLLGGIRENDKQILFYSINFLHIPSGQEIVLYDFSRQVNDTIKHWDYFYSVIKNIDSVEIAGKYRKRFEINQGYDYWVEGIGSVIFGLLHPVTPIPTSSFQEDFVCFHNKGLLEYKNPAFDDCNPISIPDLIKMQQLSGIKIYSGAVSGLLHIENIQAGNKLKAKIVDNFGRLIKEKELTGKSNTIELTFSKGFYFVLLIDKNNRIVTSRKLIKM